MSDGTEGSWATIVAGTHRAARAGVEAEPHRQPAHRGRGPIHARRRRHARRPGAPRVGATGRPGEEGRGEYAGGWTWCSKSGSRQRRTERRDAREPISGAAYDRFLETANAYAVCEESDPAGWTVATVVAHIAANDRSDRRASPTAMAGEPTAYDNRSVYRAAELQRSLGGQPDCARTSTTRAGTRRGPRMAEPVGRCGGTGVPDEHHGRRHRPGRRTGPAGRPPRGEVRVHLPLHRRRSRRWRARRLRSSVRKGAPS